jgi:hypothetical protein
MNYCELPESAAVKLIEWCGLNSSDDLRARLVDVARFDAKTPFLPYDSAGAAIRSARNEETIRAACAFVAPYFEQLESLRRF